MTDRERRMVKLHAIRSGLDYAVETARKLIRVWLNRCEQPYVAFSGGKDSLVMLHLIRREANVPALFGDDEHLYPGTEEMIARMSNLHRICGSVQHCEWYQSWSERPDDLPEGAVWVDSDPDEGSIIHYAREHGFDGAAIGIRTEESGARTVHIRSQGKLFFACEKQVWQCAPIAGWSARDVWGYIVRHDLEYHPAYDVMAEEGIEMGRRRVGPFAPAYALDSALPILRRCFPDTFRQFANEYPEANRYV